MKRLLQNEVETPLSIMIVNGKAFSGSEIMLDSVDSQLTLTIENV